ncbi:hypothetical protein AURDEDRAFT_115044 [Auricularia subglabra TFB-10046 SS5]|nr:hypothetical protein AURDEDRAFT_115044 [Auricularia subglabra TFB-10046 SS5]
MAKHPPLQRLPNELVRDIIEYSFSGSTEELARLCLVSSAVRAWVQPVLYRTVFLGSRSQVDSFVLACSTSRSGEHTSSLSLTPPGPEPALAQGKVDRLLQCVSNLKNLRIWASGLPYVTGTYNASHLYISGTIHHSYWQRSVVAPHVTHLFIEDPYCPNSMNPAYAQHLFPALTHAGFVARPFIAGLFLRFARDWLANPTLQRLNIIIVYNDEKEGADHLPAFLPLLQVLQDARVHVFSADSYALLPAVDAVSSIRRARLAGADLGSDALRGTRDVWSLGVPLWPAQ